MKNIKKLTLLHSNDMHGDFMAEDADGKLSGGVSMLSGYINQVRAEEENTIYCIAGDMLKGSIIDSEFKGLSTIEVMNMLSPDVVTIGNHEADYGIAHMLFIEKCARFPIINANFYITTNGARLFKPYYIVEEGGMRILFIGVLTAEVLAAAKGDPLIGSVVDIGEAVHEIGRICNAHNAVDIDCTVVLTHIGFEEDKKLAEMLDPAWGVDIIIGGHSHTFLEAPEKVNDIVIVQAGTGTDQIGRFDLFIDTDRNCLDSYQWEPVPIDDTHCPRDLDLENLIAGYKDHTDKKYNRLVTHLKRQLTHPDRYQETELGNLFADILCESLGLDIMLLGSGTIRTQKLGPIVTYGNLVECFGFDDFISLVKVTGAQLKQMILYTLRDEVWEGDHCEFYQYSDGLRVVYDKAGRVIKEITFFGQPVDDEKVFSIGVEKFHYNNFEKFFSLPVAEAEKNGKSRKIATSSRDILEEYLSDHQNLDRRVCGRLVAE